MRSRVAIPRQLGSRHVWPAVPSVRLRRQLSAYAFVGPALLLLALFVLVPMIYAIRVSLFDYGVTGSNEFTGLANYLQALRDQLFWKSIGVTSVYAVGSAALGLAWALGLAVLVTQRLPFMGWFRVLYFIPSVGSIVAVATIWLWMLDYNLGLINYGLSLLHLGKLPFLQDARWALGSVIFIGAWIGASYNLPIFAAGLESVSRELYEAAQLDGARAWQRFRNISLPSIAPITRYTVIMAIIGSFQVLGLIDVLTNGGPENGTLFTIKYIWQQGWDFLHLGYASAISMFMLLFLFVVTWQQLRAGRE
jgi:ABC-type sugar transport system permease subunit